MWLIGGIIAIACVWALNYLTGVLSFITGNMAEEIMAECAQSRDQDQQQSPSSTEESGPVNGSLSFICLHSERRHSFSSPVSSSFDRLF